MFNQQEVNEAAAQSSSKRGSSRQGGAAAGKSVSEASTQKTAARGRAPCIQAAPASSESAAESDNMALHRKPIDYYSSPKCTALTLEALTAHNQRSNPKLLRTDNGVLLEIASWCEAPDLMVLSGVSARFRGTIQFHDSFLWRALCRSLWGGRFLSTPHLMPYLNALRNSDGTGDRQHHQPVVVPSPSSSPKTSQQKHLSGDGPQFPSSGPLFPASIPTAVTTGGSKKIPSWREAFVRSVAQSHKTRLTAEELQGAQWQIRFLVDESIPPQPISFHATTGGPGSVRTQGFDPMRWELYQQGGQLHVHVFPTQTVSRDPNTWQWILHNPFIEIRNVSSTAGAASSSASSPSQVPELRPWFPVSSPSTQGGDRLFSSCRDTDLLGGSSSGDNEDSEPEQGQLRYLSSAFTSKRRAKREKEKFLRQTFSCEVGDDLSFSFQHLPPPAVDYYPPSFGLEDNHDGYLAGTKIAGHGGGCDGEDPPPYTEPGGPAKSCPACIGAATTTTSLACEAGGGGSGGAAAGRTTIWTTGNKHRGNTLREKSQQLCASLLSQSTAAPLLLLQEKEAQWEQTSHDDLHSSQQRALSNCPILVRSHVSEHLLESGQPLRPP